MVSHVVIKLNALIIFNFRRLKEIFKLDNNETDLREASILDYYTSAVYWGIQQKFTAQQLSGFFSVIYILLDNIKGINDHIF